MIGKIAVCMVILATISSSCLALNAQWDQDWVSFVKTHNKVYKNKIEELHRRFIWEDNMKKINEHNQNPKATFTMGMNQFGDLTNKEFGQKYLNRPLAMQSSVNNVLSETQVKDIPVSVDWRSEGCVGNIINQGQCGSSWGFGVAASLEGVICVKTSKLVTLSVQQLLDCSGTVGNQGCNGGYIYQTFDYIKQYGLESNDSYPYTATDQTCQYDASKVVARCKGAVSIAVGDENALTAALANVGPVAIAVDASQSSFQFYTGGLYYEPNCNSEYVDHGVVTVGYGSLGQNQDFYIVKNTWGTTWGDKGYIYMSRNRNNNCGIATQAAYPLI